MTLVYRWAIREHIPFIKVDRFLPKAMRDKLPAAYKLSLETKVDHLHSHEAILSNMMFSLF